MTTINNLTIEQMRGIVDGAPEGATHTNQDSYFKENDYGVWSIWVGYWNSAFRWPESEMFLINDLRTAIAKHDSPEFKVGDWVVFINPNMSKSVKEIKSLEGLTHVSFNFHPFHINLIRHATPEEIKAGHRIDDITDHVTDIRNHLSPSTRVVDL